MESEEGERALLRLSRQRLFVEGEERWGRFNGRVEQVEREAGRFQRIAFEDEREWVEGLVGKSGKRATTRHPLAAQ